MLAEVLIAVSAISIYILYSLITWIHERRKRQRLLKDVGIPGPDPDFFLGNFTEMKLDPTPNHTITRWLKQYGDVFGTYVGEVPVVVIKDLELLKQVFIKDFHNFTNRMEMFIKLKPLTDSVLCLENQRWKEVRSVLTPTFSSSKIKLMFNIMKSKTDILEQVISERSENNEEFDIYEVIQGLTVDIIAECALAMKTNSLRNLKDPLLLAVRGFFRLAHNKIVEYTIMFPFLTRIFTIINNFFPVGEMTKMSVKSVNEAIAFRRSNPQARRTDFLQLLLDASEGTNNESPSSKKRVIKLTDDEIVGNAFVFLLAGYETSSCALAFTFYLLVKHPDIQEKLYQEICDYWPENEELTYDKLHDMQYLDQVFNESLRYYPPVTGFINRDTRDDIKLGKWTIPKGVTIQVPVWDIHHDPELWPDPWKFDPDRFSQERKSDIHSLAFLPFGAGPRNCVGMRFAQLEAKLAIASIIRKFKLVPSEKTEETLTLICPTAMINPAKGVHLRAVRRND